MLEKLFSYFKPAKIGKGVYHGIGNECLIIEVTYDCPYCNTRHTITPEIHTVIEVTPCKNCNRKFEINFKYERAGL